MKFSFLIKISPGSFPKKGILKRANKTINVPMKAVNIPIIIRNFPKLFIVLKENIVVKIGLNYTICFQKKVRLKFTFIFFGREF